jgi:uncharacterized protein (DUF1330 family)
MIVFARIHDRARFLEDYAKPTADLMARFGGEYVVRAPGVEAWEGGLFDGASAVISRWPDKAAMKRFYNSPDYAPLKAAREAISEAHIMVVEDPA